MSKNGGDPFINFEIPLPIAETAGYDHHLHGCFTPGPRKIQHFASPGTLNPLFPKNAFPSNAWQFSPLTKRGYEEFWGLSMGHRGKNFWQLPITCRFYQSSRVVNCDRRPGPRQVFLVRHKIRPLPGKSYRPGCHATLRSQPPQAFTPEPGRHPPARLAGENRGPSRIARGHQSA
jgi:hypothetical protein